MKKLTLLAAAAASFLALGCSEYLCLAPPGTTASSKLTLCHVKGNGKYELITVKASAAQAHADHGDFLAPAGAKKNSDCVEPAPVPPPVTPPPTGTPETVPPTTTPPADTVPPTLPPLPIEDDIVKELPEEIRDIPCAVDDSQPQCQL